MDGRHDDRALADARRHAFDRAGADVTDREHAAPAALQRVRETVGLPVASARSRRRSGRNRCRRAPRSRAATPCSARRRASGRRSRSVRVSSAPVRRLRQVTRSRWRLPSRREISVSVCSDDRLRDGDAADQVVGHRRGQACAAHQDVHARRMTRQEHRRLAGGVAAADHHHLLALAEAGLHRGGGVVDRRSPRNGRSSPTSSLR